MEPAVKQHSIRPVLLSLSAILPFVLYLLNATGSLGFADAAEFALVTKLLSTAHPPGFPAYVLLGHLWSLPVSLITGNHIWSMILFSAACSALTALLIFLSTEKIIAACCPEAVNRSLLSFAAAASFSFGSTVWYWSNSVEVYTLQSFAIALALYGILGCSGNGSRKNALIAGTGIGIGLANHHLTMVIALPFLLLMAYPGLLTINQREQKKKGKGTISTPFRLLPIPNYLYTVAATAAVWTVVLYGWMFWNAAADFPFEFGNPDTSSRLLYHLAGGAWMKNTAREVSGIAGMRLPYFLSLIWWQFLPFLIFIIGGIFMMVKAGAKRLALCPLIVFIVILAYQLRIDQTSDTDAYLIPGFVLLAPFAGIGLAYLSAVWRPTRFVIPALLLIHIYSGFQRTDKRSFDVSESLMKMLDASAPENAVILISDWTLVIQYHYYRLAEGFRTDLTVLNYDLKFTNYRSIPVMYPDFYKSIAPYYDGFVKRLGEAHPQEIYNTGCTLDSPELMNSYRESVLAIQRYCEQTGKTYMVDPKAFVFQIQNGMMTTDSRVSGCFVSKKETGLGTGFLDLPFRWLDSPITLTEPAATDKLVDFEAMLDFHRNLYRSTGDAINLQKAENSYQRIKTLQRKVKRNMPFVFRKD